MVTCVNLRRFFIVMKAHLLLTGSEYTYRKTMGHSRDGMLISTGLGWVSSCVSINESIWGGSKTAAALT